MFSSGNTNADSNFVQALYKLLALRTASSTEINGWLAALPTLGRIGAALAFLGSTEVRTDAVTQLYTGTPLASLLNVTLLDRATAPSAAEVAGWVGSGLDLLSIEAGFGASQEYFSNG